MTGEPQRWRVGLAARGAIKVVSNSGALTVNLTGPAGNTPTVYSDEALTTSVSLPATVADGATSAFYFGSPGTYQLSVKNSAGTELASDYGTPRPVTVFAGEVSTLVYDTRFGVQSTEGNTGRFSASTANAASVGLPGTVQNKSANYTALAGDLVRADATSAGFTVTLPTNPSVGSLVTVKKVDSTTNAVTVAGPSGVTIEGSSTASITSQYAGAVFECVDATGGANVWIIAAPTTTNQGPAGPPGIVFRGAWAASTSYSLNDVVTNGGSSYISLQQHTSGGSFPGIGANWALFTQGTGSGGLGLLGVASYNPNAETQLTTTSTTYAAINAALQVTFTAPASGNVVVAVNGRLNTAATQGFWGLMDGSNAVVASEGMGFGTLDRRQSASFYMTGLTPGNSYTYKWAHASQNSGQNVGLYVGQSALTTAGGTGAATMSVTAA